MRYQKVVWNHSYLDEPVLLYSELGNVCFPCFPDREFFWVGFVRGTNPACRKATKLPKSGQIVRPERRFCPLFSW